MAYIGNTVQNQGFAPAIDYFNGNGVTVTFTLSRPIASVAQVIVAVDNVIQNPSSSFTVAGNAITFTSAPLSGTNNIWVEYTSLITTYQGISQDPTVIGDIRATGGYLAEGDFGNSFIDGNLIDYVTGRGRLTVGELDDITFYHGGTSARSPMMDLYYAGGAKIYGTTALTIPVGTTAERPGTPENGMIRYNSTISANEIYQGGAWNTFSFTYAVEVIAVAGGGGGGCYCGGGGGAGGLVYSSSTTLIGSTAYTVTVGAAGTGGLGGANNSGTNGTNSSFGTTLVVATGGGGGAYGYNGNSATGNSGGSGGGSTQASTASGTAGQGNNGGQGTTSAAQGGGGGGGAGVVGGTGTVGVGGTGGNGLNTYSTWASATSTGASGYYAGGGGGGDGSGSAEGTGGAGGGGNGRGGSSGGSAGTANTGGGGGGGGYPSTDGYNGGSGIVIIRYAGTQRGTGGTVVTTGGYTYHTFTSSGTYTS